MNDLEMYREQLALCDDKIIDALVERSSIIEKIMAYKEEYGMPILQPHQEEKQKRRLEEKLKENKYKEEIFDVFGCILRNSKRIQARKLFDYNIVLIGFMGAGKSTISDFLKTVFAMEVVEMDQIIAEREGMSISDIFETYGEEYFRNLETELLIEMQSKTNVVISCGGGVPMRERNVVEMKKNGRVVLLTAKPETILSRVKDNHDRPLLEGNKNVDFIADLMEKRREKYQAAADIVIETDGKDKLEICDAYDECANTDVQAVFRLILDTAVSHHMKQDDLPKNILILSDMEFDAAVRFPGCRRWEWEQSDKCTSLETLFKKINRAYEAQGYQMPRLVFWNICSRTNTVPLQQNEAGVALISGFSPAVYQMVLSNELDPYRCLLEQLNAKRYDMVEQALKERSGNGL